MKGAHYGQGKKRYSEEFKQEAVRLLYNHGEQSAANIAISLGVQASQCDSAHCEGKPLISPRLLFNQLGPLLPNCSLINQRWLSVSVHGGTKSA